MSRARKITPEPSMFDQWKITPPATENIASDELAVSTENEKSNSNELSKANQSDTTKNHENNRHYIWKQTYMHWDCEPECKLESRETAKNDVSTEIKDILGAVYWDGDYEFDKEILQKAGVSTDKSQDELTVDEIKKIVDMLDVEGKPIVLNNVNVSNFGEAYYKFVIQEV